MTQWSTKFANDDGKQLQPCLILDGSTGAFELFGMPNSACKNEHSSR
jgi:hypothetical protein